MLLILILLQNGLTTPCPANFYLGFKNTSPYLLMTTSKLQMNLYKAAIKIYSEQSTWLLNELNIEYVL